MKKTWILLLLFAALLTGCGDEAEEVEKIEYAQPDTLYQVALLQSLVMGEYEGTVSAADLKACGDTGIGTFDAIDGEMIMLDPEFLANQKLA